MGVLTERIAADLKAAMLARDEVRKDTLKGLKSAILYEEVARGARETGLEESIVEQIVVREAKKREEAASLYDQGGNAEAASKERSELEILQAYLPQQLSEDELLKVVEETMAELKPAGMQDMGRVIGAVKSKVGNSADGALIAKLVKDKLQ